MNWDPFLWVSIGQHEVCMGSQVSYFFRGSSAISYIISARHQSKYGEKQGMSGHSSWYWCFPSIRPHSQCLHVSGAKNCSGGRETCTGISWEKRVFSSPLSVLQEVLPVWFCFMIILILCETFKIVKLRSCSYKAQKCFVECVQI